MVTRSEKKRALKKSLNKGIETAGTFLGRRNPGTLLAISGAVAGVVSLLEAGKAQATSIYWDAAPGTSAWGTATNWNTGGGDANNPATTPTSTDVATFNVASSISTLSAAVTAYSTTFDTGAGAYTIGTGAANSQTMVMGGGATIQMTSGVTNNQTYNVKLQLGGDRTASSYYITNESTTNKFIFNGSIGGFATTGVAATKVLTVSGAGNMDFNGVVTRSGASSLTLTKSGNGTLKFNNSASKIGLLTLNAGTIDLAADLTINDAITGGTGFSGSGGTITTSGGKLLLGGGATGNGPDWATSGTVTINAVIANGGTYNNIDFYGGGTFVLKGDNTYTGGTQLGNTAVQIGVDSVGSVGSITSSALGTGTINFGAGTAAAAGLSSDGTTARTILNAITFSQNATLGSVTNTGKLTFSANANLGAGTRTLTLNSDAQFDGILSNGGLTKAGAGTLTLTNSNTFGGNVTVSAGTLKITDSNALGTGTKNFYLQGTSRKLELANNITLGSNITMNLQTNTNSGVISSSGTNEIQGQMNLTGGGTSIGSDGASTLTLSGNITANGGTGLNLYGTSANANTVSGIIADGTSSVAVTKDQAGTWVLSNANTYKGNTKVSAGTLKLTNNLAIQNSAFDTSGAGTLDVTTINTPTFGGLTSSTSYALPANVTSLTLNPQSGTVTYSGNLSGGATGLTLTKTGSGTQVLSGTNSYTGLTTVSGGELNIQNAGAIGGSQVTVTAGQLALTGVTIGSSKSITINGGGTNFWGGLQSSSGTSEWQGAITIGSTGTRVGVNTGTFTVSGTIGSGTNNFGVLFRPNTGTLVLSGANSYLGDTTIISGTGGSVQLSGGANRLPTATKLIFGGSSTSGVLDLNGQDQEVAGIAVASGNINELKSTTGNSIFTVNTAAASPSTYSGKITGSIALVKKGADTLTLTGSANTYTGGTTIQAGTLEVTKTGNIDTSAAFIQMDAGATFIRGIANGTTLAKDLRTQIATDLNSTAEVLSGTAGADRSVSMSWRLRSSGEFPNATNATTFPAVHPYGGLASDVVSLSGTAGDTYVLQMTYSETEMAKILTGQNSFAPGAEAAFAAQGLIDLGWLNPSGAWVNAVEGNTGFVSLGSPVLGNYAGSGLNTWGVNTSTNTVWAVLNHNSDFAAIPEPGSLSLLGMGMLGLMGSRRRKQKKTAGETALSRFYARRKIA